MSDDQHAAGEVRDRLLRILAAVVLLVALALAYRADLLDPEGLRDFLHSFGIVAPIIWILLYLVAVFIPYATTVMTIAAGLAFGTVWGAALTFSVTIFANLLPFTVARKLGRKWVEARVRGTRLQRYADAINRNAFLVVFYLRLIPSIPYELQNYVAGVTRITYGRFILASTLGIGPIILILTFLGDALLAPDSTRFLAAVGIWVAALVAPLLIALARRNLGKPPLFSSE